MISKAEEQRNDITMLEVISDDSQAESPSSNNTGGAIVRSASNDKFYVCLDEFRSTVHHDSWFRGASDYEITIVSASLVSIDIKNNTINASQVLTNFRFKLRRKYINKKKWVKFKNNIVVSDWVPELQNIAIFIIEDDGRNGKVETNANLTLESLDGKIKSNLQSKYTYDESDEFLGLRTYARRFILPTVGDYRSEEFFHGEGVNGDGISYKLSSKRHNW